MNVQRLLLLAIPLLPAALALACGGGNENLPPPPPPPPAPPVDTSVPEASAPASASADAPPAPPPAPPVTLTQGKAWDDPPMLPTVKILSPANNQVIPAAKAGDLEVKLDVKNWQTKAGDSHIHVILDDKDYKPIFDQKKDVLTLSKLPGGDALAPGQHVLIAFPSHANHESVKTPGALAMVQFWIDKKGDAPIDLKKPLLIYSRPKGKYVADADHPAAANHLIVDFQLANDKLSASGDHVHITVAGPGIADSLAADANQFGPPFFLDNLQDGSYSVKLDLLGADGKNLPGPWSSVTRTIAVLHQ